MNISRFLPSAHAALATCALFALADRASADSAQNYTEAGQIYRQDFDSLPFALKTNSPWFDGETIPGWQVWFAANRDGKDTGPGTPPTISASDGTASSTRLYSLGSANSPERALGASPGATAGHTVIAFALRNKTGQPLRRADIAYTLEQWRTAAAEPRTFAVDYRLGGEGAAKLLSTDWTPIASLSFGSPITSAKPQSLDGNSATSRNALRASLENLDWKPDLVLWIRFVNRNETGGSQLFAIDDFTFAAR